MKSEKSVVEVKIGKKINQTETDEEINEYFQREDKRLCEDHGFDYDNMNKIWKYFKKRERLLNKCGERMSVLKLRKFIKVQRR